MARPTPLDPINMLILYKQYSLSENHTKRLIALYWRAVDIFNVQEGGTYIETLFYLATNIAVSLRHARSPALAATQVCRKSGCFYSACWKKRALEIFSFGSQTRVTADWLHSADCDVVVS